MHEKKPVAVLIHGHHLQAPEWETLGWGAAELCVVGRIPRGIEIAVKEEADLIIWGTGASTDPATGKMETSPVLLCKLSPQNLFLTSGIRRMWSCSSHRIGQTDPKFL